MAYDIIHKNSTVAGTPPTASEIEVGEIAINAADAELYVKDTNGNIRKFQNTTTGAADGVQFTQAGTGAVQRTVESKLKDVVSVKDFGAVGDGVTDDTAAIQAAIDYASAAAGLPSPSDGAFPVCFPPGKYKTGTLTVNGPVYLKGAGKQATYLSLKTGVTTSLLVFNAVDVPSVSLDDFSSPTVCDMTLLGNRPDSTTVGVSHGIECPDATFPMTTQYAPSVSCYNLEIINFTGSGIVTGSNRNVLWLDHVICRYCNNCGLVIKGVDNKISNCEFGVTGDAAVKLEAGGTSGWVNCYFYFCEGPCLFASSTAVGPNWFTNCVFDTAGSHLVSIQGPIDHSPYVFTGCRFSAPGRGKAGNIYSHIATDNLKELNVHSCYFGEYSIYANKSKYLLDAVSAGYVSWLGNTWNTGDAPYQTGIMPSGIAELVTSDISGKSGFGATEVIGNAKVGVNGDVGLQSTTKTTARYISRTDASSVNPLARAGFAGVGANGFQGEFSVDVKTTDLFDGPIVNLFKVTGVGNNILIGNPTPANASNGIQIKQGGSIFGNPVDSGFLFVDAGALKYKGSGGTITTIAPA